MSDERQLLKDIRTGNGLPPLGHLDLKPMPIPAELGLTEFGLTMDQIRREAFELLGEAQELTAQSLALYTCGVTDLVLRLSKLAGEEAMEPCLDKNGEARG